MTLGSEEGRSFAFFSVYFYSVNIMWEMWPYIWLGMAVSSVIEGGVSSLVGIEFGDNFNQEYLTDQNGIAIARTEVKLKQKIFYCNLDHKG